MQTLCQILAVVVGAGIGYSFGLIQNLALRHHEKKEQRGELKSGWTLMPGSGARVAYLLIALILVQVICPMLFAGNTKWLVSGGLVAGYGWVLFQQLRQRRASGL